MPRVVDFSRTVPGKLLLALATALLLRLTSTPLWLPIAAAIALTSLLPRHRHLVLLVVGLGWCFLDPPIKKTLLLELASSHSAERWVSWWPVSIPIVFAFATGYMACARRFPQSAIGRRPVRWLVLILIGLFVACQAPLAGLPWLLLAMSTMTLSKYIWYFAFWLSDCRAPGKESALPPPAYWQPFWGVSSVPLGKGPSYLQSKEAKDDQELAISQLKGFKLILWATILKAVLGVCVRMVYGSYGHLGALLPLALRDGFIPPFPTVLTSQVAGHPYPIQARWLAVGGNFVLMTLGLAVVSHKFVGVCRMAGFNIARNFYKPFSATSLADFYNRIYYYFKELLVTFYFFPTYLRYFRRHPRLRLFTATIAAASFGNFLYHWLREGQVILLLGIRGSLRAYASYAVYALVLGVGIGLSQLRATRGQHRQPTGIRKAVATAGVILFFGLMSVFDDTSPRSISDYAGFLSGLFIP